jgi:hypothetical protein
MAGWSAVLKETPLHAQQPAVNRMRGFFIEVGGQSRFDRAGLRYARKQNAGNAHAQVKAALA